MQRTLRKSIRHIAENRIGYLFVVFLLIAAVSCGVRTALGMSESDVQELEMHCTLWRVLLFTLQESGCALALLLCAIHPFGCAIAAGLAVYKGFIVGMTCAWWWLRFGWSGALPFFLAILPSCVVSMCITAWGSCAAGTMALFKHRRDKRYLLRMVGISLLIQCICVLLRCIGCIWMT